MYLYSKQLEYRGPFWNEMAFELKAKKVCRLAIEMRSTRRSLRDEDDRETCVKYRKGGDKLLWVYTSSMNAEGLTKKMKPDLLLRVLRDNECQVDFQQREWR